MDRGSAATPTARRRVLHVVNAMHIGGLQSVVENLCMTTDPDRFECRVLSLGPIGTVGREMRARGFRIDGLEGSENDEPGPPDRLAPLRVYRYLRQNPVEVVHSHNTQAMFEGLLPAFFARVPIRIHTDHARLYPDRAIYLLAERVLSHLATRVVAVSDHTRRDLETHQKIASHRIETIPNGIDGNPFRGEFDVAAKRRELGLPPSGPVIGLAARYADQKGLDVLIQTMPTLLERFPDLHLLLAGEGEREERLRDLARELGVAERTHLLGPRRDVPELYAVMDAFMLPSYWEGLPMSVLEAMAAGLPVIGSDVGGVATAVRHGVNGLLCEPGRPDELAASTIELLSDPARLDAFSSAARKIFEEEFSAARMTARYEALYEGRS